MKIDCSYSELLELHKIIPNPKNPNKHPKEQIERLAKIIEYQGQRHPIIISKRSGFVVVGHGRLEAIKLLGWESAAVDYQDFESEAQEYAFVTADNAIAEWATLDLSMINTEMLDLGPDFDVDLLGIKDFVIDPIDKFDTDNPYTRKIESPIYEITGDCPSLNNIYDLSVSDDLIKEIETHDMPSDIKAFLKYAAFRHIKFNYKHIAEYYAHASPIVQHLMEKSALVVIDFDKAIEYGFVKLSKNIMETYQNDYE